MGPLGTNQTSTSVSAFSVLSSCLGDAPHREVVIRKIASAEIVVLPVWPSCLTLSNLTQPMKPITDRSLERREYCWWRKTSVPCVVGLAPWSDRSVLPCTQCLAVVCAPGQCEMSQNDGCEVSEQALSVLGIQLSYKACPCSRRKRARR
jgi:hypothetical protein